MADYEDEGELTRYIWSYYKDHRPRKEHREERLAGHVEADWG